MLMLCISMNGGYMITILSRYFLLFLVFFGLGFSRESLVAMQNARNVVQRRNNISRESIQNVRNQQNQEMLQQKQERQSIGFLKTKIPAMQQELEYLKLQKETKRLQDELDQDTRGERIQKIKRRIKITQVLMLVWLNLCLYSNISRFNFGYHYVMFYIVVLLLDKVSLDYDISGYMAETWVDFFTPKNQQKQDAVLHDSLTGSGIGAKKIPKKSAPLVPQRALTVQEQEIANQILNCFDVGPNN